MPGDIDLLTLKLFVTICDARSLLAASKTHNLASSAISKRMQQLEKQVGTRLLDRINRGLMPTYAGLKLAAHARTFLAEADRLAKNVEEIRSEASGEVRVMVSPSLVCGTFTRDLGNFISNPANKDIRVRVFDNPSSLAVAAVRRKEADFAIVNSSFADVTGLQTIGYASDHLCIIVRDDHQFAAQRTIDMGQCVDEPLVLVRHQKPAINLISERLARPLSVRAEVPTFDSAIQLVSLKVGASFATDTIANKFSGVYQIAYVPIRTDWLRRNVICFLDENLSTDARRFLDHLADAL